MPSPLLLLQRFFNLSDKAQNFLRAHWNKGANGRTVIILVAVGLASTLVYQSYIRPPDDFPLEHLVTIPEGASLQEAARSLEEQRVVNSAPAFRVLLTLLGHQHDVKAGDYMFKEPRNIFSVARIFVIGQFGLEPLRITIPEGATTERMAKIYSGRLERFDADAFLAQTKPAMEGYLFPDTYFFLPNATEDLVIRTMRQNFDDKTAALAPLFASSTRSKEDIIIMASILEREGNGRNDDRSHISGILWNRIDKGMPLQVDAVFLYTIGRSTFSLTKEDLTSDSPYNTYKVKGLPPTPIGSPSLQSIEAALKPIPSKNLFYLADRAGNTYYSRTYAEHARKKAIYIDPYR